MPPRLLDTNVLVHAAAPSSPLHERAARLVDLGLRVRGRFCIAPQILVEFAAVITRPRWVHPPLEPVEAARIGHLLYRSRRLAKLYPKRGTVSAALQEGAALGIRGPAWYDLFLAVTMREAGVREIVTENAADFRRFPFIVPRSMNEAGLLD